jgi:hypothetical protein
MTRPPVQQDREGRGFSSEELDRQEVFELPRRDLMITVTVLGIPIVGVSGIALRLS